MDITHHVDYFLPGAFMPEHQAFEITERDPEVAARQAPDNAFCFVFYDLPIPPKIDLDPEYFRVVPTKRLNVTKRYYIGGTVMTASEIVIHEDGHPIMLANMRANHWKRMVLCRTGNWQPFEDDDEQIVP